MSSSDFGEEPNFNERLIPAIPGVEYPGLDQDELGVLDEAPDEESEEDVLEEVAEEIRLVLDNFGVEGARKASDAELIALWERMDMNDHLIADLVLWVTSHKRQVLRNELATVDITDIYERAESLVNPPQIRRELIEQVAPNLMKLGYRPLAAYKQPRHPNDDVGLAYRTEGWLLGLPILKDVPKQVNTAVKASKDKRLKPSQVFRITRDEIVRQARIIDSNEFRRQHDSSISYEAIGYRGLRRMIRDTYRIADHALSPFIATPRAR